MMSDIELLHLFYMCDIPVKVTIMLQRNMHLPPVVACFSVTSNTCVDGVCIQSANATVCVFHCVLMQRIYTNYFMSCSVS